MAAGTQEQVGFPTWSTMFPQSFGFGFLNQGCWTCVIFVWVASLNIQSLPLPLLQTWKVWMQLVKVCLLCFMGTKNSPLWFSGIGRKVGCQRYLITKHWSNMLVYSSILNLSKSDTARPLHTARDITQVHSQRPCYLPVTNWFWNSLWEWL